MLIRRVVVSNDPYAPSATQADEIGVGQATDGIERHESELDFSHRRSQGQAQIVARSSIVEGGRDGYSAVGFA